MLVILDGRSREVTACALESPQNFSPMHLSPLVSEVVSYPLENVVARLPVYSTSMPYIHLSGMYDKELYTVFHGQTSNDNLFHA